MCLDTRYPPGMIGVGEPDRTADNGVKAVIMGLDGMGPMSQRKNGPAIATTHGEIPRSDAGEAPTESPELLLRMYTAMATARACDERLWILSRQGRARFVVTGRGHEAAQAGSAINLRPGYDYAYLYYRSMTTALVLGMTPDDIMRSVLNREGDTISGGRQLPNHFSSRPLRIPTISSVVGGAITHAVGSAYAAKVRGTDWVSACYFGEGAAAKGDFHEALNFAAIHHLA